MTDPDPTVPQTEAGGVASRGRRGGAAGFLRDVLVILLVAVLASFLIKTFLFRSFYIPSGSMRETLQIDDRVIVNLLTPAIVPVSRGDVVVFTDPGGWLRTAATPAEPTSPLQEVVGGVLQVIGLAPADSDDHLIKRVIGLPGDEIVCCNALGQMTINGVPIDEPYVRLGEGETAVSGVDFSVTVPEDSLWVMGDNRYNSEDSRFQQDTPSLGFVPMSDVVGRAFVVSWPLDRFGWLGDYPGVFSGVPREDG